MAIQLNEEIRDEARKMSEYVVEDTKRTVEMLDWLKGKRQQENNINVSNSANTITDIIKTGAAFATGNIAGGMEIMLENIMPRLRDRLSNQLIKDESFNRNKSAIDSLKKVNDKVLSIRNMLTDNKLDAQDIDDILYDIQVIIDEFIKN